MTPEPAARKPGLSGREGRPTDHLSPGAALEGGSPIKRGEAVGPREGPVEGAAEEELSPAAIQLHQRIQALQRKLSLGSTTPSPPGP